MCRCNPQIRTPFCGRPDCLMPVQKVMTPFTEEQIEWLKENLSLEARVGRSEGYYNERYKDLTVELCLLGVAISSFEVSIA